MKTTGKTKKDIKNETKNNICKKASSKTKKNIVEMPIIPQSKINEQIDFASNIFKLYSGINTSNNNEQDNIKKETNTQTKLDKPKNSLPVTNNKNTGKRNLPSSIIIEKKNSSLNNKIEQVKRVGNSVKIKNSNDNENIDMLIAQYNEQLDLEKLKDNNIIQNNNNNQNNNNIDYPQNISSQEKLPIIAKEVPLPKINITNNNSNNNQNFENNNINQDNNIINNNQQFNKVTNKENITNSNFNNCNGNYNQNYKYPTTNQLIDNIQFMQTNKAQINSTSNNSAATPWVQLNMTYEDYEKMKIKEENRKKQEEFRKMLDDQRINQKNQNKEKEICLDRKIDLPIITNNNEKNIINERKNSLRVSGLVIENQNANNLNNIEQNMFQNKNIIDNVNNINTINIELYESIAKKYQNILNNFIDEKTKEIELQRNQVISDNNLIEKIDKNIINHNEHYEEGQYNENYENPKEINIKKKVKSNNKINENKNKTEYKIPGKSENISKKYKIEEETKKPCTVIEKKKIALPQRSKSIKPVNKPGTKSSEVKIKYTIKERKNNSNKKLEQIINENNDDDPVNKLKNIQSYIKGIISEYKK